MDAAISPSRSSLRCGSRGKGTCPETSVQWGWPLAAVGGKRPARHEASCKILSGTAYGLCQSLGLSNLAVAGTCIPGAFLRIYDACIG